MAYASRTGTLRNLAALREAGWGLMVSAAADLRTEGFDRYALDNGAWAAFQAGRRINIARFCRALDLLGDEAEFVIAPDIVLGGEESLALSLAWLPHVLDRTERALIAVQNGMTPDDLRPHVSERVGIFVGGDTAWKEASLGEWGWLKAETGCHLHVGRVNTKRRIRLCALAGADSFDGSSASRFAKSLPRLDLARRQPCLFLLESGL
ncbi:MAG: hypothetical protein ACJ8FU_08435 [Xanthobacteraceae bacterium]